MLSVSFVPINLGKSPLMHPRNRHQDRYDFVQLLRACPALKPFVIRTPDQQPSINFADPAAVRMLNRALLSSLYGIASWDYPSGYLCPPIPGRADYLHGLADLLADCNEGTIPRGPSIRALDIGVGASCIYPLLGHVDYGWRFVGTEVDPEALASARAIVAANAGLSEVIELRQQVDPRSILKGMLAAGESFDLTLCNPPFHKSAAEAAQGSARKWQNLGKSVAAKSRPTLNFGGRGSELWCRGGETTFVKQMISESVELGAMVYWFTSLIADRAHLSPIKQHLRALGAQQVRTIDMAQGQKQSRFIAWSFLDVAERAHWRRQRWSAVAP